MSLFPRSRALAGLLPLVLLGALGACSNPENQAAADETGPARTITHRYGTTTVEGTPDRVVALGITDSDTLLALGVTPVALRPWRDLDAVGAWADDEMGNADPEVLSATEEVTVDELAALNPDLIVAVSDAVSEERYDLLSGLAPTVVRPKGYPDYGVPWPVATRMIGKAVGKTAEAEQAVADVQARIEESTQKYPQLAGKTATVAYPNPEGGWWVYTDADARGQLVTDLGMKLPPQLAKLDNGSSFYLDISEENTDLLESDVIVLFSEWAGESLATGSELFQNLDTVQRGDVVEVNTGVGYAMSYGTVLSIPYVLDRLGPRLADSVV